MIKKYLPIILAGLLLISCSNNNEVNAQQTVDAQQEKSASELKKEQKEKEKALKKIMKGAKTTPEGLSYVITKSVAEGKMPQKGDVVKVHYQGRKLMDTAFFDSSYKRGEPLPLKVGVGMVIKGWDIGIPLLKVGEKATLIIPDTLGYGKEDSGGRGPLGTLIFDVELVEIADIGPYKTEGLEAKTTASGLKYYVVQENAEGEIPKKGEMVHVHYSGYLEDGTKFDSSWDRMRPFNFQLGIGRVIKGWDEGIGLLKVGEKARFVIPSELGYGSSGAGGVIPPNATLIFDVELLKVQ